MKKLALLVLLAIVVLTTSSACSHHRRRPNIGHNTESSRPYYGPGSHSSEDARHRDDYDDRHDDGGRY